MADFFIDKTILSPRYKQESSYGLRIAFFRRVIIAPCYDAPLATGNGRGGAAKRLLGGSNDGFTQGVKVPQCNEADAWAHR
ncbi:hypothetical protein CNYM01_09915 [Colletotrichum nymphaeae SA-01]|uniref:Uncharacterized protein n=1 Tax=Colletotrichum nymphaeae SA-01 TaxID=1460502 RepID=A0A135S132_9PEZI|nr:hypothetical protein CNYM01_09915 [Colletotrichum nymphaeae SA-01]